MRRRDYFREILRGTVAKVIAGVLAILGTAATIRELVLPEAVQARLNLYRIWSLDWPWWLWAIVVLTAALIVLFEGAYRVVCNLETELSVVKAAATAPDVRLEGTFPGVFVLHARGHACEIRTGPIIVEESAVGIHRDGDQVMRVMYPRALIEFPVVSDLRNGEKEIELSLFYGEGGGHHRWPDSGTAAAMTEFIRAAQLVRRYQAAQSVLGREDVDQDFSKLSSAELEAISDRIQQPFEIGFDITYWNTEHTQRWKRSELLVYEPQKQMAFVRHSGTPVSL